jgi:hypothetical protein
MIEQQPRPGDRVAFVDPTGESSTQGTVRYRPKGTSLLRAAIWTYVKVDGVEEPQWLRTESLRVTEAAVPKPRKPRRMSKAVGTIGILNSPYREQLERDFPEEARRERSGIFLQPKKQA